MISRLLVFVLACVLVGGCTTSRVVPLPQAQAPSVATLVKPGDTVQCTLRSGATLKFKVVRVEPAALIGEFQQVRVAELNQLKVTRFSPAKTLFLVAGLVALGFAAEGVAEMGTLGFPAITYP